MRLDEWILPAIGLPSESKQTGCAYHFTSSTVKPSELLTSLAGLSSENSLMETVVIGRCLIYIVSRWKAQMGERSEWCSIRGQLLGWNFSAPSLVVVKFCEEGCKHDIFLRVGALEGVQDEKKLARGS